MSSNLSNSKILTVVLIISLFYCTECWNFTENLLRYRKDLFNTKSGRLISFDASDGNLKLDLEFSIPFIEVPVQKSMDYAKNFVAKINLPSLILTGLMIFVSAVIVPTIFSFWGKKFHLLDPFAKSRQNSSYRHVEEESSVLWQYLTYLDTVFMENDIDTTSCLQRSICSMVKKSKTDVFNGNGSSVDKIVDGVSSNEWFLEQILNTPLHSAVANGQKNVKCREQFTNCTITPKNFKTLFRKILKYLGT